MYLISAFLFVLASNQVAFSTELCKGSDWWYDTQSAKCRPCRVCDGKSFVMEPCSEFMNTLCVDLIEISRSIDRSIEKGSKINVMNPKWHETEAMDRSGTDMPLATASVAKSLFEDFENQWGHVVMVILCITLFFISGSVVLLILKISGKRRCDNLAKAGTMSLEDSSGALTFQELASKRKTMINKDWRNPPTHHWYRGNHPGAALNYQGERKDQTVLTRLNSGHIRALSFEGGGKTFAVCAKCHQEPASPRHILTCLGLCREDLEKTPALVMDFLRVNDLVDLV